MITCTILANGDLAINADADAREVIADRLENMAAHDNYWSIWWDLFEPYSTNGSYELFDAGQGNPDVGLTSAPCIAESMDVADDGERSIIGRLWWFPNYQVIDPLDVLRDVGKVVFSLAPSEPEARAVARGASSWLNEAREIPGVKSVSGKNLPPEADDAPKTAAEVHAQAGESWSSAAEVKAPFPLPREWSPGAMTKTERGNMLLPIYEDGTELIGYLGGKDPVRAIFRAMVARHGLEAIHILRRLVATTYGSSPELDEAKQFLARFPE